MDPGLLRLALTHRSWSAEHAGDESNERLEFLGDAVLGMVIAANSFRCYPAMREGEMAKVRADVVSSRSLNEVAVGLGLGPELRLGKGEDLSGGRTKASILADATEAVIGAVYLDGGLDAASEVIMRFLGAKVEAAADSPGNEDHKTMLQELAARLGTSSPVYRITDTGPDHAKRFFASVSVGDEVTGEGEGRSKKQAEQAAAHSAWSQLVDQMDGQVVGAASAGGEPGA